jgi:hypothetical protein
MLGKAKVLDYLFQIYEFFIRLNRPIFGKYISEWLKLGLVYSFLIWGGIILFKVYNQYLQYKELDRKEKIFLVQKRKKEKQINKILFLLKDLQLAYTQISEYFSKEEIQKLINKLEIQVNKYKQKRSLFYNPINIFIFNTDTKLSLSKTLLIPNFKYFYLIKNSRTFPYGENIKNFLEDLKEFFNKRKKINNEIHYKLVTLKFFNSLNYFYKFIDKHYNFSVNGEIQVSLLDNKKTIFLYFTPFEQGLLKIKPIMELGFIQYPEKLLSIPSYTFFYIKPYVPIPIAPVYFGYVFELNKGGKNNE